MLNKPQKPPFFIHAVISWCGLIAQNLILKTNTFSFLFCERREKYFKNISSKVCRYKISSYICSVIKNKETMTTIEKVLKANGILTTTEGVFGNTVIIAWDDLGIEEQARFKIDTDLSVVYKFLGY